MMPNIDTLQDILNIVLPILGYYVASRRPGHTRAHLAGGAMIGGGLSGAIMAALVTITGGGFSQALPFALLGLVWGAIVGVLGVTAFVLGRWLKRRQ
jgi:hypothetical protein